jgi:hypothetical protein
MLFLQIEHSRHYQADDALATRSVGYMGFRSPHSSPPCAFRTVNVQVWAPNWDMVAKTLFAPVVYRNPTIQTAVAISLMALSSQESTLIVLLTLNMSEHFFKET